MRSNDIIGRSEPIDVGLKVGLTGFHRVSTRFLLGFTGFYRVLLGFTYFYWVLLGFTGFPLGFTGFPLGFTGFYWVLLGFTGFYWVLRDFMRLE